VKHLSQFQRKWLSGCIVDRAVNHSRTSLLHSRRGLLSLAGPAIQQIACKEHPPETFHLEPFKEVRRPFRFSCHNCITICTPRFGCVDGAFGTLRIEASRIVDNSDQLDPHPLNIVCSSVERIAIVLKKALPDYQILAVNVAGKIAAIGV
jgi:hypothetical protein